jgi:hypothetical protein
MGFRHASRTQTTRRRAGMGFRPARSAFIALRAFHRAAIEPAEADPRPPMRITRPFRGHPHESARPPAGQTTRGSPFRRAAHASSPGLRSPYGTCQRGSSLWMAVNPFTTARRVRGLATPCATYATAPPHPKVVRHLAPFDATRLPARRARWSAHGLHPSRVFPRPRSVLLSEPLPSCRYLARPPPARRQVTSARSRLQGFDPAASPYSRRHTRRRTLRCSGRRSLPGVSPLQSLRPPELAHALNSRGLPSHPWVG